MLPYFMDEETLALWLLWEQTEEDRAEIRAFFQDGIHARDAHLRSEADTLCERSGADILFFPVASTLAESVRLFAEAA